MNPLKKLMGETVIYGFSTILGRFINWLLVPLYTRVLSPVDNGIFTNLMGYVALLVVLLTYGTETGFFRFATKDNKDRVFITLFFVSPANCQFSWGGESSDLLRFIDCNDCDWCGEYFAFRSIENGRESPSFRGY